MAIYTRTGDKGETGLFSGKRVSKDSLVIEAIGSVDELNAIIGMIIAQSQISNLKSKIYKFKLKTELIKIQSDLFVIGASLANPKSALKINSEKRSRDFEALIDEMTKKLPRLFNFILPGGGEAGAMLHLARTVARRAERRLVTLSKKQQLDSSILIYINRLSDLLFTMARYSNLKDKRKETIWHGR